jgi:glycosyltransferase involved in cell wall biosynthesis
VSGDGRSRIVIANWRDRSHPRAGGAEAVCEHLAAHMAGQGHEVVLLAAAVDGAPAEETRDGYRVVRRGGQFGVYLWSLLWLARHRRSIDAVIDSQNGIPFFAPLVLRRRTPVLLLIYHVHQEQFGEYLPAPAAALGRFLEGPASRLVYGRRAVVTISPSSRLHIRRRLGLRGEITVAAPGCTTSPGPHPDRTAGESIVSVGRLVPHKQTHHLVEAVPTLLAKFPGLTVHIVGDGPEAPRLARLVAELGVGDHVVLHGAVPAVERDRLVAGSWLAVAASAAEGWCLSVIEANALGVPALAYARPGVRDSVRPGETGWLLSESDDLARGIADALVELADPVRARRLAAQARSWASRFTWEEMGDRVLVTLGAERRRLSAARDARERSDLSTVVTVPHGVLAGPWRPLLRADDVSVDGDGQLRLLLRGADTEAARLALYRCGLGPAVLHDPAVRFAVARPADLLSLHPL